MADQKPLFSLDTRTVILVKPSKPTPSTTLSLSTIDNNPDLNILCHTVYVYRAKPKYPNAENDPASVLKEALSKTLVYYYPLAGKLLEHADGTLRIICNSDGVPFLEANANCELSSLNYLDGIDVEMATRFVFELPSEDEDGRQYPLVLKVTKFLCGGFTIGMGLSHSVCDGFGAAQFFRAMTELAAGLGEPLVKPVWERERLVGSVTKEPLQFPMDKASSAVSPFLPTKDLCHESFNVDGETVKRLKINLMNEILRAGKGTKEENFTTLEALAAYVWRSRTRALQLNSDGKTLFCLAVGIRHLLDPPLSNGYYGNAFVAANLVLAVKELHEKPLSEVAKLLKVSKKLAFNNDYIRNSINVLEKMREGNVRVEGGGGASMVLTDWRQLGLLEEVDFGWKASVNIVPVPWNMFGYVDLCLFLPPSNLDPAMKGGVRVFVSLPSPAMPKFKEEMEALKIVRSDEGRKLNAGNNRVVLETLAPKLTLT